MRCAIPVEHSYALQVGRRGAGAGRRGYPWYLSASGNGIGVEMLGRSRNPTTLLAVLLAGWLAFMGLFTNLLVPETKGIPIEDMHNPKPLHSKP
jgi:hypothetical protein